MIILSYKANHYTERENNRYSSCFHNTYEFLLPEKQYVLQVEEHNISASYGDLLYLRANTLHYQPPNAPFSPRYILHVDKTTIDSLSNPDRSILEVLNATPSGCISIRGHENEFFAIMDFLAAQGGTTKENSLSVTIELLRFFDLFLKHLAPVDLVSGSSKQPPRRSTVELVHAAQQYIAQNLDQPLSLDSISAALHVNKYHLSHTFTQLSGYSVKRYITHCRLENACRLLHDGASIEEAWDVFNVQDINYFKRVFKKEFGISPAEYSRRYSKKLVVK